MKITIYLRDSNVITYKGVKNTYVKGKDYCIVLQDKTVHKQPLVDILKVD